MILSTKDKIILKLVDTTGQEKFRALTKSYFKNAEAVLFVFSMNDKNTFDSIRDWIMLFKENNCKEETIPKYLVGNKNDLEINVEHNLIDKLVQDINIPFISISAKDNSSIDKLFEEVGKELYLDYIKKVISIKFCSTLISKSFLFPTRYFGIVSSLQLFSLNSFIQSIILSKVFLSFILKTNKTASAFLKYDLVKALNFSCPVISTSFKIILSFY